MSSSQAPAPAAAAPAAAPHSASKDGASNVAPAAANTNANASATAAAASSLVTSAQSQAQPMPAAVSVSPTGAAVPVTAPAATANGAAPASAVNGVSPSNAAAGATGTGAATPSGTTVPAPAAADKSASEKEGENKANLEKKTLFVSGIPVDVRAREVHNFFRFLPGFVSAVLSTKSRAPVAFVTFNTNQEAASAQALLTGQHFDLDSSVTLRLEFARAATHATTTAAASAASVGPKKRGGADDNKRVRPSAYSHMTFPGQPQYAPAVAVPPPQQQQPPIRLTTTPSAAPAVPVAAPVAPANGKTPCATLFVANLPPNTTEQALTKLFSAVSGFRRCKLTAKNAGSAVAFVEFADVTTSSAALSAFQDYRVNGTADKHGLRIEFAKASMGLPSAKSQAQAQGHTSPLTKPDAAASAAADAQAQAQQAAAAAAAGYAAADPNATAYAAYAAAAHAGHAHAQFNPLLGGALPQAVYAARPY